MAELATTEYGRYPYGLRNVVLVESGGGNYATLRTAQLFSFVERIRTEEFSGDDRTLAIASYSDVVDWSLESGGINLDAYALMTGRTVTETGSTPNRVATLTGEATEQFPYFRVYGKALTDDESDVWCVVYRCKLISLQGQLGDGEFHVTQASGVGIDDGTNGLFDFVQNETAADIYESLGIGNLGLMMMGVKA